MTHYISPWGLRDTMPYEEAHPRNRRPVIELAHRLTYKANMWIRIESGRPGTLKTDNMALDEAIEAMAGSPHMLSDLCKCWRNKEQKRLVADLTALILTTLRDGFVNQNDAAEAVTWSWEMLQLGRLHRGMPPVNGITAETIETVVSWTERHEI